MIVFTVIGLSVVLAMGYVFMPRTALVVSLAVLGCYLQPLMLSFSFSSEWSLLWIPIVIGGIFAAIWDIINIEEWLIARRKVKEEKEIKEKKRKKKKARIKNK